VTYELDAISVGHDLSRGTSVFTKAVAEAPFTAVEVDEDGRPADASGAIYDEADGRELTSVS
jgi:hypothetical protein